MAFFVHDGDHHGAAFALRRVLLRTLEFLVLGFGSRLQTFRAGAYGKLIFLSPVRRDPVLISRSGTHVVCRAAHVPPRILSLQR